MGNIHIIRDFPTRSEGTHRTIRIYTPDAYNARPDERFGVVYMQDGQNVFAHADSALFDTWCANWAIEQTAAESLTAPWIIVGIDHDPDRFAQYSPWDEPRIGVKARGSRYVDFLTDELKPYIDGVYRTRPESEHTAIMGASLGGLISLYAGWRRPDIFGRLGGVSASVMWSLGHLFDAWVAHSRRWSRIYLDVGQDERIYRDHVPLNYAADVPAFYRQLRSLGYADHELRLVVEPGGEHDERAWQRRLPGAFAWLLR